MKHTNNILDYTTADGMVCVTRSRLPAADSSFFVAELALMRWKFQRCYIGNGYASQDSAITSYIAVFERCVLGVRENSSSDPYYAFTRVLLLDSAPDLVVVNDLNQRFQHLDVQSGGSSAPIFFSVVGNTLFVNTTDWAPCNFQAITESLNEALREAVKAFQDCGCRELVVDLEERLHLEYNTMYGQIIDRESPRITRRMLDEFVAADMLVPHPLMFVKPSNAKVTKVVRDAPKPLIASRKPRIVKKVAAPKEIATAENISNVTVNEFSKHLLEMVEFVKTHCRMPKLNYRDEAALYRKHYHFCVSTFRQGLTYEDVCTPECLAIIDANNLRQVLNIPKSADRVSEVIKWAISQHAKFGKIARRACTTPIDKSRFSSWEHLIHSRGVAQPCDVKPKHIEFVLTLPDSASRNYVHNMLLTALVRKTNKVAESTKASVVQADTAKLEQKPPRDFVNGEALARGLVDWYIKNGNKAAPNIANAVGRANITAALVQQRIWEDHEAGVLDPKVVAVLEASNHAYLLVRPTA